MRASVALSVFAASLVLLGGCATRQGSLAPIEERRTQDRVSAPKPARPATPAPSPAAPQPLPETGAVVKPLPEGESPAARALALPAPGAAVALPPAAEGTMGDHPAFVPAVAELVAKADQASAEGRHEAARASLERALKISPRNPALWQRLATVSYAQEDWEQAKSFAERSNSLAPAGSALASRNWMLIGNAETRLGNQSAAAAAFARAGASGP